MLNNGAYMHKYNAFLAQSSTQDVISMYANTHRYEFKAPQNEIYIGSYQYNLVLSVLTKAMVLLKK